MDKIKTKVYIDGANMFYTQKKLEWIFDWVKIKKFLEEEKEIIEWRYYVGIKKDDEKMQKYLRYLTAIGFNTITKPLKKIKISDGETLFEVYRRNHIYKANFDIELIHKEAE